MNLKTKLLAVLGVMVLGLAGCRHTGTYETMGSIERLDPGLDAIISKDAKIEKLSSGFKWAEGPVWIKDGDFLAFSDVPSNVVHRWDEKNGLKDYLRPSGYTSTTPRTGESGSNGLTVDAQGHLVLCQHGDRRVARLESDGRFTTIADNFEGRRFNSPNDLVYSSKGDLYFTDPPYGLEKGADDPKREIPFSGVYRVEPNGRITLLTKELTRPNGLAFSPDEKALYIAVSDKDHAVWMAYDVKEDGNIANGRVFYDVTKMVSDANPGLPDGMKVDEKGNLLASGPGGILIFSPEAKLLGIIKMGQPTGNCAFGEDGSTLYMTSNHDLCRVRLRTKGKIPGKRE
jgi:gluconolactonase